VDDEDAQVRMLVAALRKEGFEATGTRDPDSVMDLLQHDVPDLALVDLMMPGLNGIELARKIRDGFPAVRVILTSAYHLSERQLSRADCGVVGFVPKPYVLPELADFLRAKIARLSGPRLCAS
jgi:CheY-like chemotaxis protein